MPAGKDDKGNLKRVMQSPVSKALRGLKALAAGRSGGRFLLWVNPSQPTSPSLPLHNKYEVLGLEGQVSEDAEESPCRRLSRASQPLPCLKTVSVRNKRNVNVIAESF